MFLKSRTSNERSLFAQLQKLFLITQVSTSFVQYLMFRNFQANLLDTKYTLQPDLLRMLLRSFYIKRRISGPQKQLTYKKTRMTGVLKQKLSSENSYFSSCYAVHSDVHFGNQPKQRNVIETSVRKIVF